MKEKREPGATELAAKLAKLLNIPPHYLMDAIKEAKDRYLRSNASN